jgi:hypothetical protein
VVNCRDLVRCYITPYIGACQLYTVDKRVIHDLCTVRTVHRVLMKALGDLGITVAGVRQPRQAERETMGRKGVWTPQQSAQFLRHHTGRRMYAAWALAIVTGLRRGEIAGLKWDKVDLDRGVLLVHCPQRVEVGSPAGGRQQLLGLDVECGAAQYRPPGTG